jgi:hypothetical protein
MTIPVNTIANICDLAWQKAGITAANISNRIAETLFCLQSCIFGLNYVLGYSCKTDSWSLQDSSKHDSLGRKI